MQHTYSIQLPEDASLITGDALSGFSVFRVDEAKKGIELPWRSGYSTKIISVEPSTYTGKRFEILTNHASKEALFSSSEDDDLESPGFSAVLYGDPGIAKVFRPAESKKNTYLSTIPEHLVAGDALISMPLSVCCRTDMTVPVEAAGNSNYSGRYYLVKTVSVSETIVANAKSVKLTFDRPTPIIVDGIGISPWKH